MRRRKCGDDDVGVGRSFLRIRLNDADALVTKTEMLVHHSQAHIMNE